MKKRRPLRSSEFVHAVMQTSPIVEDLTEIVKGLVKNEQQKYLEANTPKSPGSDKANEIRELKEIVTNLGEQRQSINAVAGQTQNRNQHSNGQSFQNQGFNNPRNGNGIGRGQGFRQNFDNRNNSYPQIPGGNFNQPNGSFGFSAQPRQGKFNGYCNHCGYLGHKVAECRKLARERGMMGSPPRCFSCNQVGHYAMMCPSKTQFGNNTGGSPNHRGVPPQQGNA